jgi:hypothetical protein
VLPALAPADRLPIEEEIAADSCLARRPRTMANVRAKCLLKIPAEPSPELRMPGAAAQTRMVSVGEIRRGSGKSARRFKGIICDAISEFESSHPSHAVRSLPANV